ncbi:Malectin/receptor-like protein kinase family protein [Perilla frutescens var. hirtella]|uniref:non-specific serine/threonine protein kinase n=1 Tax=Perilla frutescens var. hirtella TaxID=608512 RepID=A0AAD4JAQ4_PERFH|nr:Malectin/receptor-like protein kinase family protein [Perilla frutescens var. hirtella]
MNLRPIPVALLFLCFFITFSSCSNNEADFAGDVSINCGSTRASAARNGRQWLGDVRPKLTPLLQLGGLSAASTAISQLSSADPVPHKTARISQSQFSYAFQLNPGQKIIRLHFNPSLYRGFKGLRDLFTVEAGPFTLLSNFSASLTADALGVSTFVKEFCLNIQENQQLTITFSPESSQSQDRYAFINGIEFISVPPSLSYFNGGDIELRVVGHKSLLYVDDASALEIVHRLNIKEDLVPPTGDFDGVFPKWAVQRAEKFKNNTWKMPVEVGFKYLIRLHFSEAGLKIAEAGGSMFKILINEMIAYTNTDQIENGRDQESIILYKDYMVVVRGRKQNDRRDISISLQSFDELADGFGVLAGFEIVKLSNPDDSLASPNPLPPPQDSGSHKIRNLLLVLGYQNASATVAIAVISLLCIILHKLREIWESNSIEEEHKPSANAERHCRRFSLAEIQLATRNFNGGLLIGKGGFGKVYKGFIDDGQKTVAVKRLRFDSRQGAHEFLTEIETLSELRHMNLVSLIGYCSDHREMILVYEYMACGTLADHLYKIGTDCSSLNWKQRLDICIGAARGLDYLHTGLGIIHRDVKASNILLDENLMARVSDFGLARSEDRSKLQSHVITLVKGTRGYLDPHYIKTGKLTRKSDVYAFGVVLLEVVCGRPALNLGVLEEERLLSSWALDKISKGEVDQIVASILREEILPNSLKTFVEVAERCLHDEPKDRPTMSQIVLQLEFALERQESNQNSVLNEKANVSDDIHPTSDGMRQSSTAQLTMASTDMQNITLTPNQQINDKVVSAELTSGEKYRRNATRNTRWRLWPWDTLWNRVKPSKNSEFYEAKVAIAAIQCRKFSLHEIQNATDYFNVNYVISRGGLFIVYKGLIDDGATTVAIKRFESSSHQGINDQFGNEIQILSRLKHRHLVSLIGYCDEKREMIIVFTGMVNVNGTLRDHLHNSSYSPLTWKQRLEICLGVAKGLDYLHTGTEHIIIHRDVKTNNILLDEKWVPRMYNFCVSKGSFDSDWDQSHVTTEVKGTFGYLDPDYFRTSRLTVKSDVYAFGVVLFEVLSASLPITSEQSLGRWGISCFRKGELEKIIDSNLQGQIEPGCLNKFVEIAVACLSDRGIDRPTMRDVVGSLESAMQIQEAAGVDGGLHEADTNLLKIDETQVAVSASQYFDLCRKFSLHEIRKATDGFNVNYVIGRGEFGNVYKGLIDDGATTVAIKRFESSSYQAINDFINEIQILSRLKHRHLVSLIGYCDKEGEMIIVFNFMVRGTLSEHLYNLENPPLTWNQRLEICLAAAKGLDYLHTGAEHVIIHGDVKTANILLDEKWVAKMYDFGCSKGLLGSESDQTHVSTVVKGTFGYLDPEYYMTGGLTVKSDVYSFGVVMLEVISVRPPIIRSQQNLAEWGISCFRKGKPEKIIDSNLKGQIAPECLNKFVETAIACLGERGIDRPTMRDVIGSLEFAMNLQKDASLDEEAKEGWPSGGVVFLEAKGLKFDPPPTPLGKWGDCTNCNVGLQEYTIPLARVCDRASSLLSVQFTFPPESDITSLLLQLILGSNIHTRYNLYKCYPNSPLLGNICLPHVNATSHWRCPKVAANESLDLCRYFSLHEIIKATDDFNDDVIINSHGFGNVYKGLIDDGATAVAIKRLDPSSNQGAKELATEIEMLSRVRHHHLVPLIGYCHGIEEMIIVYDYMARGSLQSPLTWNQRLEICLGAAKGLDYLHTGTEHVIIHRDVNTTNILLDEKWVAKMYDFGLSKGLFGSESDQTHVSTQVKGTFGYLDPDYFRTLQLTAKSDVYSFGVVLFEVLCARPVIIPSLPRKQVNLTEWGISCFRRGKLEKIIDSNLRGQIEPGCLNKFVEIAVACLSDRGIDRPMMRDVVGSLESAMQLQEAAGVDEAPTLPWMAATTSRVDLKESQYEDGLESRRTQKAKLLPLSSAKQSDDSSSFKTTPPEEAEALRKWKIKAGKAMYALKTTIDKELLEHIRAATTPKEA